MRLSPCSCFLSIGSNRDVIPAYAGMTTRLRGNDDLGRNDTSIVIASIPMAIGDEAILRPSYRVYLTLSFDTAVCNCLLRMTIDMAVFQPVMVSLSNHKAGG